MTDEAARFVKRLAAAAPKLPERQLDVLGRLLDGSPRPDEITALRHGLLPLIADEAGETGQRGALPR